jgi:RNA polymerase sigma-70 factor, ECF subfamily
VIAPSNPEPEPEAAPITVAPNQGSRAENRVAELVAREYESVWRFLRRLGVPAGDVDDATQRVFARVLGRSDRVQPGSERAYLMRAAFRAALELQRARKRSLSRASEVEVDETTSALPLPDQRLAAREELALLDRALAELSADLRAVLTLFEIEGLTFTEIALALELPRGTVASRLRRARAEFAAAARRLSPGGLR